MIYSIGEFQRPPLCVYKSPVPRLHFPSPAQCPLLPSSLSLPPFLSTGSTTCPSTLSSLFYNPLCTLLLLLPPFPSTLGVPQHRHQGRHTPRHLEPLPPLCVHQGCSCAWLFSETFFPGFSPESPISPLSLPPMLPPALPLRSLEGVIHLAPKLQLRSPSFKGLFPWPSTADF